MTAVAADFDNDGWPDIYVACDSTPSLFFRNNRDGTFTEDGLGERRRAERRRPGTGRHGARDRRSTTWMATWTFSKPISPTTPIFCTATTGRAYFDDLTSDAGLGVETRFIGWGAGIVDLDNDGLPGPVLRDRQRLSGNCETSCPGYPFKTPRVIFRNLGDGKFEELIDEAGPALQRAHCSRGCAFGDFDNDGDMDIARGQSERAAVAPSQRS